MTLIPFVSTIAGSVRWIIHDGPQPNHCRHVLPLWYGACYRPAPQHDVCSRVCGVTRDDFPSVCVDAWCRHVWRGTFGTWILRRVPQLHLSCVQRAICCVIAPVHVFFCPHACRALPWFALPCPALPPGLSCRLSAHHNRWMALGHARQVTGCTHTSTWS